LLRKNFCTAKFWITTTRSNFM